MKRFCLRLAAIAAITCVFCSVFLTSCSKDDATAVDYSDLGGNSYAVTQSVNDGYKLYTPQTDGVTYGFVFFLGTAMSVSNYDYVLGKIAAAGIAVYVPSNPFPDLSYGANVLDTGVTGAQKFFVGGHSQGGGAAVRYACENTDDTAGAILFSPLVSNDRSLKDGSLPALYFEAQNDYVLTDDMQNDAKSRMNASCRYVLLEGAGHMCYGQSSLLDGGGTTRDKREIQDEIVACVLDFMQNVINAQG